MKAKVVRKQTHYTQCALRSGGNMRALIGDLIGSVRDDGLPADLSSNKKKYRPALIRAKMIDAIGRTGK